MESITASGTKTCVMESDLVLTRQERSTKVNGVRV
jgi:hypothetical protein